VSADDTTVESLDAGGFTGADETTGAESPPVAGTVAGSAGVYDVGAVEVTTGVVVVAAETAEDVSGVVEAATEMLVSVVDAIVVVVIVEEVAFTGVATIGDCAMTGAAITEAVVVATEPDCTAHAPGVPCMAPLSPILTHHVWPFGEVMIMPFVTVAVCASKFTVCTVLNTASPACISPTVHVAADDINWPLD
jgi:hypothetical protein